MLLDEVLPHADFLEQHALRVCAEPAQTLAAAKAVTAREVPVFVALMALRGLPTLRPRRLPRDEPILTAFERLGFVTAAVSAEELVIVGVGRFWRPGGGLRRISAGEFDSFDEPGYARTAFAFRVEPDGDGCRLSTETRVAATDEAARRSFGRYWVLIRPGSGAIRRVWLRAIRKRAERGA